MDDLIFDDLRITGFRGFADLRIPTLGRVNLLVGKNSVGKSSVLEAVRVYAADGETAALYQVEEERVGTMLPSDTTLRQVLEPLRYKARGEGEPAGSIRIGPCRSDDASLVLAVEDGPVTSVSTGPLLVVRWGEQVRREVNMDLPQQYARVTIRGGWSRQIPCAHVPASRMSLPQLGDLWDGVALTDSEEDVLHALRLIRPDIHRLSVVGGVERSILVRIGGEPDPVKLTTLGDGLLRVFQLALALANAREGLLLVDEFENGIHYSAQADLWRLVFRTSARLGTQVLATTHSSDCVAAFQQAATEHPEEGVLIRLQERKGEIEAVLFDEEKLGFATREQIEVRG